MMSAHWVVLVVLICCALASAAGVLNEVLHGPDCPNYRASPVWVRMAMSAWSIALAYRAADLGLGLWRGRPELVSPNSIPVFILLLLVQVAMLVDTMRTRLPARIWRRFNRILWLASCGRRGPAMAELAMRGAVVLSPKDSGLPPDAV